jgi:hypothetical protein
MTTMPPDFDRCALVVVDFQSGFDDLHYWSPTGRRNNPDCEAHVASLVERWREAGRPVVFVRHDSDTPGSPLTGRQRVQAGIDRRTAPARDQADQLVLLRRARPARLDEGPAADRLRGVRHPDQPLCRDDGSDGRESRLRRAVRRRRLPHLRSARTDRGADERGRLDPGDAHEPARRVRDCGEHVRAAPGDSGCRTSVR